MDQEFTDWMKAEKKRVEDALVAMLEGCRRDGVPPMLVEAMEYSLMAGGKRLRPMLVIASAMACGARGDEKVVMDAAVGIEMIQTYSLIHDDLPCMDNDDFRRGKPTSHKKFGEGLALLAGDALQTGAFQVVADGDEACRGRLCWLFSRHAGPRGMVAGQVDDTMVHPENTVEFLDRVNRRKTGDLLALACGAGACAAGADGEKIGAMQQVGYLMGQAFQLWDDVLDVEGDPALMGKSIGNDAQQNKLTYPAIIGLEATREAARQKIREAREIMAPWMPQACRLASLAGVLVDRKF